MNLGRYLAGYLPLNLASGLASFGAVYVFTRLLSAEQYGVYALMIWTLGMIHTVTLTWVEAAAYRFTAEAEAKGNLADHYRTALSLIFKSLGLALAVAAMVWFTLRDAPLYAATMPWIAVLLPLNVVIQVALQAHKAGLRVERYVFTESFRLLMGFLLGALAAWYFGLGSAAPFIGMVMAAGLMALREGKWLLEAAKGGQTSPAREKAWVGYGVPVAAALLLDLVVAGIDRPMIAALMTDGEAAVGVYAAGYGLADKTVLLLCAWAAMAGGPLLLAAYERGGPQAATEQAQGFIRMLLFVGVPAAVGIALVARPLGEALREEAIPILPYIAFSGLLNGLTIHYFAHAFQLVHRTREGVLLMLVPAVLKIVLNLILIPQIGLMGAVYSTLISYASGVAVLALFGRRHVALPLPPGDLLRIGLAALAMWPVIALLPDIGGWAELILKAGAGALVYAAAALVLDAGGVRTLVRNRFA
ncbi:lipopolysaccharide biosynthesis protein [Hyphomonas sp.]|uniref:lipopolysaccharide biosynthesis protein n=1 Tax=Hyphomonas sp. TaxID=87 RepID=UPI0033422989